MNKELNLRNIFIQHGSLIELPLNHRIFLHDEECFLWVEEGSVDIFGLEPLKIQLEALKKSFAEMAKQSTPFLGDKVPGALHFLYHATMNTLLLQFTCEIKTAKPLIIAVSNTFTKLRKIALSDLYKILENDPALLQALDSHIHNWINHFSSVFIYRQVPKYLSVLNMKNQLIAENTSVAYSKPDQESEKVVWIQIKEGEIEIAGMQTLTLKKGDYYYPLTSSIWFETITPTQLQAYSIHPILSNPFCREGLKKFHSYLIDVLFFNKLLKGKNERNKLKLQADLDELSLTKSLEELQDIFSEQEQVFPFIDPQYTYRCCQVVGNSLNLKFIPLDEGQHRKFFSIDEYIYELCRNSHIQYRRVLLQDNWWEKELGPFICFYQKELLPAALLPLDKGGYQIFLPETGNFLRFEPDQFSEIQPEAYIFYRKLPEKEVISTKEIKLFMMRGRRKEVLLTCFFTFLVLLTLAVNPLLTRQLFGGVIANLDYVVFAQVGFAFILTAISAMIFSLIREYLVMRLQTFFDNDFSTALWQRLLLLPTRFFRLCGTGDLFTRTQIAPTIRRILSGQVIRQLLIGFFSLIYLIPMFYYQPNLAWAALGIVCLGFLFLAFVMWRMARLSQARLEIAGQLNERMLETLLGITTIRISGCENRFFSKWEQVFFQNKQIEWKIARLQSIITVYNTLISPLSLTAIYGYMIFQKIGEAQAASMIAELGGTETFKLGDFMGFFMAFTAFSYAMIDFSNASAQLVSLPPLWNRTKLIFQTPPESAVYRLKSEPLTGEIRADHLYFRYHQDMGMVLNDISFYVDPGEFVAIIGHSGCGKSTLIRLLIGFETPESGAIYYDGRDLSTLDLQDIRSQMGIVLQNSSIMDGTIRDNVMAGWVYHENQVIQALTLAGFEEDLHSLPMGLDTVLMNGGATLSGGQKQRILIARALIGNPKILIFDEASSLLDNETQEIVSQNLARLNTTRIAIAHRLSTIRQANRIYVMEQGRIIDHGTFKELSEKKKGLFYDLLKRQVDTKNGNS